MADKVSRMQSLVGGSGTKPVPMRLFAAWEVDRTPPNCVPRLCSLKLVRLALLKPLGPDVTSITLAVKMQSSKRTLRSNEILLPAHCLLDTELELSFTLQYPHYLKQDGNKLQIILQRRKRYKNRTILGFKTLAVGVVNMSMALQRQMDIELDLCSSDAKDKSGPVARLTVQSLSSQPVDQHEDAVERLKTNSISDNPERNVDYRYSDDEEEFTSNEDGSDSEPMVIEERPVDRRPSRKGSRSKILPSNARTMSQRNLKQKFIALLKRFKITEDLHGLDHESGVMDPSKLTGADLEMDAGDIEDLIDELEDLSDSGPEMDTLSVTSTPKPSLRPFFASSRSLAPGINNFHEASLALPASSVAERQHSDDNSSRRAGDSDSHADMATDQEQADPPAPGISGPPSRSVQEDKTKPRKILLEQLVRCMPADDAIPDHVMLVSGSDAQGAQLGAKLAERQQRVVCTCGAADVRATIACLVNKIQKFCNCSAKPPTPIKVVLIGGDSYINSVLRCYVEQFSSKAPDWQNHLRFHVVPLGAASGNVLARYLASVDRYYSANFVSDSWRDAIERPDKMLDAGQPRIDVQEVIHRIGRYLTSNASVLHVPVAEAMITYRDAGCDEESTQVFIPFVSEVRIGLAETWCGSVDTEDGQQLTLPAPSGSPPHQTTLGPVLGEKERNKDKITPPSSPNISAIYGGREVTVWPSEPVELQVDYWMSAAAAAAGNKDGSANAGSGAPLTLSSVAQAVRRDKAESVKYTVKAGFRWIVIQRLPASSDSSSLFTMTFGLKEKKQKIAMRLGKKKEKDAELKSQSIEGISRLVCQAKTHHSLLKVVIDGVEWNNVKFFQLSSQWQTHIRHFPVALFADNLF